MGLDFSEIALFYYQTIPREILHRIKHKPAKTNDGPKMALMRPCPLVGSSGNVASEAGVGSANVVIVEYT